jgi:phospholipase C
MKALLLAGVVAAGCAQSGGGPSAAQVAAARQQCIESEGKNCPYHAGMYAKDTLPAGTPIGSEIPIDHVILIMQENRSFDTYYSGLDIPGLDRGSLTATNPDSNGKPVERYHFPTKCAPSPDHGWIPQHAYWADGGMDGFVSAQGNSSAPMGYYLEEDLPYYYALARTFAFSDRHFCSLMGPTFPNRMFYFAGTSWGITTGLTWGPTTGPDGQPYASIFTEMDDAKVSWKVYFQDVPTPGIVPSSLNDPQNFDGNPANPVDFVNDIMAGKLANVTYVEGTDSGGPTAVDEGPPGDVDIGQNFVGTVISAVMHSQFWKSSAVFVSYDENGGYYDHVVPPPAVTPDDVPPNIETPYRFDQYGFRVPFFAISPYAKRGYVSHVVTDHTSILRFLEARFDMPAMTRRDANADPPFDMFDFDHPDESIPDIPIVTVDQAALAACQ